MSNIDPSLAARINEFDWDATLSETRIWFDIMDDSEAADKRRNRAEANGGEACTACGRKVNQDTCYWVHGSTSGHLISVEVEDSLSDHNPYSQGWWAIGSECAKKVPAEFKTRWNA